METAAPEHTRRSAKRHNRFRGKVVWITGASSGIGQALAYELAAAGATLVLSARGADTLDRVRDVCAEIGGQPPMVLPHDLRELDAMPALAAQVVARLGRVDVLVNNGGISQRSLVKDTPVSVDVDLMQVDYLGQVALTKAVLPYMLQQQSGHIVVISSVAGKFGTPLRSAYCAAKHALHGFFDALRAEVYRDNLRVTIICPASINTEISMKAVTGSGEVYGKMDGKQARGMSPAQCARRILRAVSRNAKEVLVGPPIRYTATVRRIFPRIYYFLVNRVKVT